MGCMWPFTLKKRLTVNEEAIIKELDLLGEALSAEIALWKQRLPNFRKIEVPPPEARCFVNVASIENVNDRADELASMIGNVRKIAIASCINLQKTLNLAKKAIKKMQVMC